MGIQSPTLRPCRDPWAMPKRAQSLTRSSDAANKTIAPQLRANLPFCVTLGYDSRNLNLNVANLG